MAQSIGAENPVSTEKARDFLHQLDDAMAQVFEKVAPAVVIIEANRKSDEQESNQGFDFFFGPGEDEGNNPHRRHHGFMPEERSEGSGFIIRADGYILTNNHVVEDADKLDVKLKDGRHFTGKVVGTDSKTDIAVVKIEAKNLPVAALGDSDTVRIGQQCFAIGVPYNLAYSFSRGVVSGTGRNDLVSTSANPMYEDYIQTDAFINPGNSGGPLFDIDGRVIGMNTLINGIGRGLAFAIPSNMLRDVSWQLIDSGKVTRPWLGINIETLSNASDSKRELLQGISKGVIVNTIVDSSPALKSDLKAMDVITSVDGVSVSTAGELLHEVLKKKIGQSVDLGVWRNGQTLKIAVRTEELPNLKQISNRTEKKSPDPKKGGDLYGLGLVDGKHPATRNKQSPGGALVQSVESGSAADDAGMQVGDLITEIDQEPVADAAAARRLLQSHASGKGLLLFLERTGQKTYAVLKLDETGKTR